MGGTVIVTVRPGVQFTPDAANAFQRAEAQVQAERGRNIDVNSTYRDWNLQLGMFNAWQAYLAGGPYPGHSKALHPDDPLAFHTKGTALDSDDWTDARIVQILAENGFIRNRLYVPNEKHHFEYIRSEDKNYGKEIDMPLNDADKKWLKTEIAKSVWTYKSAVNGVKFGDMLRVVFNAIRYGSKGHWHHGTVTAAIMSEIGAQKAFRKNQGSREEIDLDAFGEQLAASLNRVDAEKLAAAILKAQGKALTDAAG